MMRCVLTLELCVGRESHLEGEPVRRRDAITEYDSCDETALYAFSVLYDNVAAIDESLPLGLALRIVAGAASEERDESLAWLAGYGL